MAKVNEVKTVKGAAETDVKKEVKADVETKVPVKAEETKAPVKEEAKAPAKAEETKASAKTEEPKAPAKKAPAKKTTAKKSTTKKTSAAKSTTTRSRKAKEAVYIEFDGKQIAVSELLENAKANYTGDVKSVKELSVYVNSDNKKAYVVVNGEPTGEMDL